MTRALYDTGCLPFSAFGETYAALNHLPRIPIQERQLKLAKGDEHTHRIQYMTYATIDIDGRRERIFGYVIPGLHYDLILGKGWGECNNVIYKAGKRQLRIGRGPSRVRIRESGWMDNPLVRDRTKHIRNSSVVAASTFIGLVKRAGKRKEELTIASVTMTDINIALEKFARSKEPVSIQQLRERLPSQLRELADAFLGDEQGGLPPHRPGFDVKIELQKDDNGRERQPPHGPLYDMSREELLVLRATLADLMSKGWIRASSSSASSPVLFARKPGGGLRFCVDFRALNAITSRDRYPLPLIRETLRALAKARFFTKLDVRAAFHRMRVAEGDEWKTAFRTRQGLFEWLVCPFGLAGAPAAFQRFINSVLGDYLDVFCSAYMDDVIIYTDGNLDDHLDKVREVVKRMREAGLKIDIDKCAFGVKQIRYLGFIIEAGIGIKVDPAKVEAITAWEEPEDASGVRSFLGFANFYRDFIPIFSEIVAPLVALTKRGVPWQWLPEHQQAFDRIKELLVCAPVLAMFDHTLETILEADSSGYGIGGVLSQVGTDGILRPVGFYSRKLSPAEANYEIHDKELLSIVSAMRHFRGELRSVESLFTVLSDHRNLQYFMTTRQLSERQVRWAEELAYYNFQIKFRAGRDSAKPDLLSRRTQIMPKDAQDKRLSERRFQLIKERWIIPNMVSKESIEGSVIDVLQISAVSTRNALRAPAQQENAPQNHRQANSQTAIRGSALFEELDMQLLWDAAVIKDPSFRALHAAVAQGDRSLPAGVEVDAQMPDCSLDERGALCYRGALWVPDSEPLRTTLVQRTHDSYITGHPGRDITLSILARSYFWPQQYLTVRRFVSNCAVCRRSKACRQAPQGLLRPLPVPERYYSELGIDFMTELPAKKGDKRRFLMVITDRLLNSVTLDATESMDAEACAEIFVNSHARFHGLPAALTSDRGSNWTGRFWRRLCELLHVEQRLSTSFHPQTDGATERCNQEILAFLRAYISYAQTDWADLLPAAMLALNNRDNTKTGMSPFFLTHGYHLEPIQQVVSRRSSSKNPKARADAFVRRLWEGQELCKAAMVTARQIMEHQANRKRRPAEQLKVGDKVWLNLRNIETPQLKKKLSWTQAKYTITKVVAPDVYELDVPSGIHNRFMVDLLRRDPDNPLPSQKTDDAQPPPLNQGDTPMWAVDKILRAGNWRGRRGLLVKWTGYSEPTWTWRENLVLTDAFRDFVAKYGDGDEVGEEAGAHTGSTGKTRTSRGKNLKPSLPPTISPGSRR